MTTRQKPLPLAGYYYAFRRFADDTANRWDGPRAMDATLWRAEAEAAATGRRIELLAQVDRAAAPVLIAVAVPELCVAARGDR